MLTNQRKMKTRKLFQLAVTSFAAVSFSVAIQAQPAGRGMPAESREAIHTLFNQHQQIVRKLTLTDTGYVATTTSTNAAVAAALQKHVRQMSDRLKSGLMVRRWDPAFAEYAAHYDGIGHQFEAIDGGIRATVTGRNAEAIKVAQNHAQVIVDFAAHGWEAHDRSHPAALTAKADDPAPAEKSAPSRACCLSKPAAGTQADTACGAGCCRN